MGKPERANSVIFKVTTSRVVADRCGQALAKVEIALDSGVERLSAEGRAAGHCAGVGRVAGFERLAHDVAVERLCEDAERSGSGNIEPGMNRPGTERQVIPTGLRDYRDAVTGQ